MVHTYCRRHEGDGSSLPDLSDEALLAAAKSWLLPQLAGVRSKSDMLKLDWNNILKVSCCWCDTSGELVTRVVLSMPVLVMLRWW